MPWPSKAALLARLARIEQSLIASRPSPIEEALKQAPIAVIFELQQEIESEPLGPRVAAWIAELEQQCATWHELGARLVERMTAQPPQPGSSTPLRLVGPGEGG